MAKTGKSETGRRYEDVAKRVVSDLRGDEQAMALRILSGEKAQEAYKFLLNKELPPRTITRIMRHGLKNFQRGKGLTAGSYALGIAKEIARSEEYRDIVDDMYNDGIINEGQYRSVIRSVEGDLKHHARKLSGLEKITASILGIAGVLMLVVFGAGISGNVIGNLIPGNSMLFVGSLLVVISLILFLRK